MPWNKDKSKKNQVIYENTVESSYYDVVYNDISDKTISSHDLVGFISYVGNFGRILQYRLQR